MAASAKLDDDLKNRIQNIDIFRHKIGVLVTRFTRSYLKIFNVHVCIQSNILFPIFYFST